ncbi:AraC family transcriptional regulator [soil metagenome]
MSPTDAFAQWRFSTDDLPEKERLTIWREVCGRTMMRMDMEPLSDAPFHCTANIWMLPGLAVSSIVTSPNRLTRGRDLLADGNDDFILAIPMAGGAAISQRGRDVVLGRGDALLMSSALPSASEVPSASNFLSLAIPAAILAPLAKDVGASLLRPVPENAPALRLLARYVQALGDEQALASPQLRRAAVAHIHDLTALAVGATWDAAEIAGGRGVRAARLHAVKADVAENLGDRGLTTSTVAARLGITPRYVNMLFETEGVTFSEFVLAQRLTRAHRMLCDPRFSGRAIGWIAFEAGFSDLSYFNRTFRRHYGVTPTDVRAAIG